MQQTIFYAVHDISNEPMMPKNLIHYCYYSCFYRSHCHFVVMRGLVASSLCVNCFYDFVNRLDGITAIYGNWRWLEWTINPSITVIMRLHRSAYISNRPSRVLYVEAWGRHGINFIPIVVGSSMPENSLIDVQTICRLSMPQLSGKFTYGLWPLLLHV